MAIPGLLERLGAPGHHGIPAEDVKAILKVDLKMILDTYNILQQLR